EGTSPTHRAPRLPSTATPRVRPPAQSDPARRPMTDKSHVTSYLGPMRFCCRLSRDLGWVRRVVNVLDTVCPPAPEQLACPVDGNHQQRASRPSPDPYCRVSIAGERFSTPR